MPELLKFGDLFKSNTCHDTGMYEAVLREFILKMLYDDDHCARTLL